MPIIPGSRAVQHEMHGARFTSLASPSRGTQQSSVWQVEIAPGTPATPHEVTAEEVLVIVAGRAKVRLGDAHDVAEAGDTVVVPPDTLFAFENAGDVPLRALVCFPVGGKARLADGREFTPPWAE